MLLSTRHCTLPERTCENEKADNTELDSEHDKHYRPASAEAPREPRCAIEVQPGRIAFSLSEAEKSVNMHPQRIDEQCRWHAVMYAEQVLFRVLPVTPSELALWEPGASSTTATGAGPAKQETTRRITSKGSFNAAPSPSLCTCKHRRKQHYVADWLHPERANLSHSASSAWPVQLVLAIHVIPMTPMARKASYAPSVG